MDIIIKSLTLNVHIHGMDKEATDKIYHSLNKIQQDMADTKQEFLDLFASAATSLQGISSGVSNINDDVTELLQKVTDGTTPEGGLSPADTAELKTALQGIVDGTATAAQSIQDVAAKYKNASEQTPPAEEPTV